MGRFSYEEADNYGNQNRSSFFSLKEHKDTARVRFMYNTMKDVEGYAVHEVTLNDNKKRYVNCLRDYNDPKDVCPFCARGNVQKAKLYVPLYNVDTGEVQVWERGKKFFGDISSICSRYSSADKPLVSRVFEIERNGRKGDTSTTYSIFPCDGYESVTLDDLPEVPKVLGGIILDKSAQEMEHFIQKGEFEDLSAPIEEDVPRRTPRSRDAF